MKYKIAIRLRILLKRPLVRSRAVAACISIALCLAFVSASTQVEAQTQPRFRAVVAIPTKYSGALNSMPGLIKARQPIEAALRELAKRGGFEPSQVEIVFHTDAPAKGEFKLATDAEVVRSLVVAARSSNRGDVLVFYFLGHGSYDQNSDSSNLYTSGGDDQIPANRINLRNQVFEVIGQKSRASVNLIFIDACQVSAAASLGSTAPAFKLASMVLPKTGSHMAVLYASSPGERAWVDPNTEIGVFTKVVSLQLMNNSRTANDLFDRVLQNFDVELRRAFPSGDRHQRPYLDIRGSGSGSYPLIPTEQSAKIVDVEPPAKAINLLFQLPGKGTGDPYSSKYAPEVLTNIFGDKELRAGMKVELLPAGAVVPQSAALKAAAKGTLAGVAVFDLNPPKEPGTLPVRCGEKTWLVWNEEALRKVDMSSRVRLHELCTFIK
jgi:hypothetical protein